MRTLLWSYLGQRQFPGEMSRFEVQHFCRVQYSLANISGICGPDPSALNIDAV
jgi:hypothetical protein